MFLQIFPHKVKCLCDERPVFSTAAQSRHLSYLQTRSLAPLSAKPICYYKVKFHFENVTEAKS